MRRRPVHCFRVALVATRAVEIAAVIQWLVTETHVLVDMRSPGIGRMAVIALTGRHEVPRVLAGRRVAVMAGRTGAEHLGVVDRCYRYPGDRGVAVLADVCRQDMRRVLARRVRAVMAADAVVGDIGVVEVAGIQAIVVWQSSQLSPLVKCVGCLPSPCCHHGRRSRCR